MDELEPSEDVWVTPEIKAAARIPDPHVLHTEDEVWGD